MKPERAFQTAEQVQHSLLTPLERRILPWIAARLPSWINSDHLTLLGFLSLISVGASYWYAHGSRAGLLLANLFLILNWFGDSLDGTLARVRNRQRPRYGFYVDHILDACGSVFVFGGLALSGYMDARVAAAPGDGGGDTATEPSGSTGNGQAPSRTKLRRPAKRADRRTRRRDKAGTSRN